jgi:lipopolysaccharide/colanic/teichoic acid biosynthesis glycosyltransferase
MAKRLLDIVLSAAALVLLAVPMLAIAIWIRLDSPGPAIFRQSRAGRGGRPFTMLKFRTMRTDADPYGQSPDSGEDPRLTRSGRFLRETSLDELPQLLNVLAGQMSLVGPRPLYERQAREWTPRQRRRLDVRPGITGYAQVHGRGEIPIEDKIELDLHYIEHRSLWMDLKILARTALGSLGRREGIYEKQYSRRSRREQPGGQPDGETREDRKP